VLAAVAAAVVVVSCGGCHERAGLVWIASLTLAHSADTATMSGGVVWSACASRSTSAINARSGSATPGARPLHADRDQALARRLDIPAAGRHRDP
jgi:hypothetical protein